MAININEIKINIYDYISKGNFDGAILSQLIEKDGSVVSSECELWDYKKEFTGDKDSYLKLMKSIVSFYNSYGGYIVYGVDEVVKDSVFEVVGVSEELLIDQQKIRGFFDKYFGRRLEVLYDHFPVDVNGEVKIVGVLFIPKRPVGQHTASAIKTAATSDNKEVIRKDSTYFRINDECKQLLGYQDFEFVSGDRNYLLSISGGEKRKKLIDHDLPDRNFICAKFIGRFDIINELWAWLGDEFQYAKVLAGEGGKGKTSIAYEFCQLLATSGTSSIEQIVWLTAKKKQFKGLYDTYIDTPESHYDNLEVLLKGICLKTGSLEEELSDLSELQLKRKAKENLESYPTFIVIDDVDSNTPDEQRRIMEAARIISNTKARILLTTRVNNIYSSDSCIEVPGLDGSDYVELIQTLCDRIRVQSLNDNNINKIRKASEGSPLFTESILRLYKKGMSLNDSIELWSGEEGELVREAALRKEIEELTPESIKILIAVSYVGGCSNTEIHQLTELSSSKINMCIEQLDNLFLIESITFIKDEPRIEASSSVSSLILKICHEILPDAQDYIKNVHEIAEGLRYQELSNGNMPEVGAAVRQSSALIKELKFDLARGTVNSLINDRKFKENPDLYFMLARIEYDDPSSNLEIVRKSFNDAYIKGQRKESFFDMWYEVEKQAGEHTSINNVCKDAIYEGCLTNARWYERYAYSRYLNAGEIIHLNNKIQALVEAYEYVTNAINMANRYRWGRIKDLSVLIVDGIWESSILNESYILAFKSMCTAINAGDVRRINYIRAAEAVEKIFFLYISINKSMYSDDAKKKARLDYEEVRSELRELIDDLDVSRYDLKEDIEKMVFRVPDVKKEKEAQA